MERGIKNILLIGFLMFFYSLSSALRLLGEVKKVEAILGGQAALPCDVNSKDKNDTLLLIVWYKNNKPFYSYDGRLQKHWRSKDFQDNSRVLFTFHREPAALLMDRVNLEDEGTYRCRGDFSLTPTKNVGLYLTIIILPSKPFFMDEIGTKVDSRVGPLHEGDTLVLNCLAVGGQPPPKLTWWKDSTLLDSTDEPSEVPNVKENQLFLILNREYAGATIQCQASNNNVTTPITSSLQINVYVSPETVSIISSNQALSAGKIYELSCYINGSHPLPEVSWWLDGKIIKDQEIMTQEMNSEIITILHYEPRIEHNGLDLTCLATNPIMAPSQGSKSHTIRLNVYYPPVMSLSLVTNKYGNNTVREGQVIQMRCMIESNPWITNTEWFANNVKIQGKKFHKSDISMTTSDLIIMNASINHIADYTCKAHNIEGTGESNVLFINVLYKPKCVREKTYINHYVTSLSCPVYSKPDIMKYYWKIENQKQNYLNENIYITDRNSMVLDSIEKSLETNYVQEVEVSCWAANEIGEQKTSCLLVLKHSFVAPDKPQNCETESDIDSITIICPTPVRNTSDLMFGLSVWDLRNESKLLAKNITTTMLVVKVENLQESHSYEITIYAFNKWGESDLAYFYANTTTAPRVFEAVTGDVGLWSGMAVGLGLVIILIIVAVLVRNKTKTVISNGVQTDKTNVPNGRVVKSNYISNSTTDVTEKPLLYRNGKINTNNVVLSRNNSEPKIEDETKAMVQNNTLSLPPVNRNNKPKLPKLNIKSEGTNTTPSIKRSFKASKHRKEIKKSNGAIQMYEKNGEGINAGLESFDLSKESIV